METMWNRVRWLISALAFVMLTGGRVWATAQDFVSYKKAYPGQEAAAYSCKVCHLEAVGKATNLNPQGLSLQRFKGAGQAKTLTADDYQAFDEADLDQDGVTNRAELDAGTDPLDAASCPSTSMR